MAEGAAQPESGRKAKIASYFGSGSEIARKAVAAREAKRRTERD